MWIKYGTILGEKNPLTYPFCTLVQFDVEDHSEQKLFEQSVFWANAVRTFFQFQSFTWWTKASSHRVASPKAGVAPMNQAPFNKKAMLVNLIIHSFIVTNWFVNPGNLPKLLFIISIKNILLFDLIIQQVRSGQARLGLPERRKGSPVGLHQSRYLWRHWFWGQGFWRRSLRSWKKLKCWLQQLLLLLFY